MVTCARRRRYGSMQKPFWQVKGVGQVAPVPQAGRWHKLLPPQTYGAGHGQARMTQRLVLLQRMPALQS